MIDPRQEEKPVSVTLSLAEWQNLITRLRKSDAQIGRLAWMAITHIEGRIADEK